ncbi:7-carboxy-7-deazaguanine synthase QueE [Verrucomicrobiota bacterium sgz303538]
MWVSEIFYSVQGEGELTGVPSVFIRLAGCNLRCTWCDTKYASWEPEGAQIPTEQILVEVNAAPASHVVITGGEPMIGRGIHELAAAIRASGKHITIETAGTIRPEGVACDLASLSPKLSGSTPKAGEITPEWIERHEKARLQPDVLREWISNYPYQLKFVVAERQDVDEIQDLLKRIGVPIPPYKVLLMPEGTDVATLNSRREMLIDVCKQKGFRYCDRLHVTLFGHRRGT